MCVAIEAHGLDLLVGRMFVVPEEVGRVDAPLGRHAASRFVTAGNSQ